MEYNKRQFKKANDKKVLHKVRKHWVVISLALLGAIGATGSAKTNAHASVNQQAQQNHSTLKQAIQSSTRAHLVNTQSNSETPQVNHTQIHNNNGVLARRIQDSTGRLSNRILTHSVRSADQNATMQHRIQNNLASPSVNASQVSQATSKANTQADVMQRAKTQWDRIEPLHSRSVSSEPRVGSENPEAESPEDMVNYESSELNDVTSEASAVNDQWNHINSNDALEASSAINVAQAYLSRYDQVTGLDGIDSSVAENDVAKMKTTLNDIPESSAMDTITHLADAQIASSTANSYQAELTTDTAKRDSQSIETLLDKMATVSASMNTNTNTANNMVLGILSDEDNVEQIFSSASSAATAAAANAYHTVYPVVNVSTPVQFGNAITNGAVHKINLMNNMDLWSTVINGGLDYRYLTDAGVWKHSQLPVNDIDAYKTVDGKYHGSQTFNDAVNMADEIECIIPNRSLAINGLKNDGTWNTVDFGNYSFILTNGAVAHTASYVHHANGIGDTPVKKAQGNAGTSGHTNVSLNNLNAYDANDYGIIGVRSGNGSYNYDGSIEKNNPDLSNKPLTDVKFDNINYTGPTLFKDQYPVNNDDHYFGHSALHFDGKITINGGAAYAPNQINGAHYDIFHDGLSYTPNDRDSLAPTYVEPFDSNNYVATNVYKYSAPNNSNPLDGISSSDVIKNTNNITFDPNCHFTASSTNSNCFNIAQSLFSVQKGAVVNLIPRGKLCPADPVGMNLALPVAIRENHIGEINIDKGGTLNIYPNTDDDSYIHPSKPNDNINNYLCPGGIYIFGYGFINVKDGAKLNLDYGKYHQSNSNYSLPPSNNQSTDGLSAPINITGYDAGGTMPPTWWNNSNEININPYGELLINGGDPKPLNLSSFHESYLGSTSLIRLPYQSGSSSSNSVDCKVDPNAFVRLKCGGAQQVTLFANGGSSVVNINNPKLFQMDLSDNTNPLSTMSSNNVGINAVNVDLHDLNNHDYGQYGGYINPITYYDSNDYAHSNLHHKKIPFGLILPGESQGSSFDTASFSGNPIYNFPYLLNFEKDLPGYPNVYQTVYNITKNLINTTPSAAPIQPQDNSIAKKIAKAMQSVIPYGYSPLRDQTNLNDRLALNKAVNYKAMVLMALSKLNSTKNYFTFDPSNVSSLNGYIGGYMSVPDPDTNDNFSLLVPVILNTKAATGSTKDTFNLTRGFTLTGVPRSRIEGLHIQKEHGHNVVSGYAPLGSYIGIDKTDLSNPESDEDDNMGTNEDIHGIYTPGKTFDDANYDPPHHYSDYVAVAGGNPDNPQPISSTDPVGKNWGYWSYQLPSQFDSMTPQQAEQNLIVYDRTQTVLTKDAARRLGDYMNGWDTADEQDAGDPNEYDKNDLANEIYYDFQHDVDSAPDEDPAHNFDTDDTNAGLDFEAGRIKGRYDIKNLNTDNSIYSEPTPFVLGYLTAKYNRNSPANDNSKIHSIINNINDQIQWTNYLPPIESDSNSTANSSAVMDQTLSYMNYLINNDYSNLQSLYDNLLSPSADASASGADLTYRRNQVSDLNSQNSQIASDLNFYVSDINSNISSNYSSYAAAAQSEASAGNMTQKEIDLLHANALLNQAESDVNAAQSDFDIVSGASITASNDNQSASVDSNNVIPHYVIIRSDASNAEGSDFHHVADSYSARASNDYNGANHDSEAMNDYYSQVADANSYLESDSAQLQSISGSLNAQLPNLSSSAQSIATSNLNAVNTALNSVSSYITANQNSAGSASNDSATTSTESGDAQNQSSITSASSQSDSSAYSAEMSYASEYNSLMNSGSIVLNDHFDSASDDNSLAYNSLLASSAVNEANADVSNADSALNDIENIVMSTGNNDVGATREMSRIKEVFTHGAIPSGSNGKQHKSSSASTGSGSSNSNRNSASQSAVIASQHAAQSKQASLARSASASSSQSASLSRAASASSTKASTSQSFRAASVSASLAARSASASVSASVTQSLAYRNSHEVSLSNLIQASQQASTSTSQSLSASVSVSLSASASTSSSASASASLSLSVFASQSTRTSMMTSAFRAAASFRTSLSQSASVRSAANQAFQASLSSSAARSSIASLSMSVSKSASLSNSVASEQGSSANNSVANSVPSSANDNNSSTVYSANGSNVASGSNNSSDTDNDLSTSDGTSSDSTNSGIDNDNSDTDTDNGDQTNSNGIGNRVNATSGTDNSSMNTNDSQINDNDTASTNISGNQSSGSNGTQQLPQTGEIHQMQNAILILMTLMAAVISNFGIAIDRKHRD